MFNFANAQVCVLSKFNSYSNLLVSTQDNNIVINAVLKMKMHLLIIVIGCFLALYVMSLFE